MTDPAQTAVFSNGFITLAINSSSLAGTIDIKSNNDRWMFDILASLRSMVKGSDRYSFDTSVTAIKSLESGMVVDVIISREFFRLSVQLAAEKPDILFDITPLDPSPSSLERICFPGPILPSGDHPKAFVYTPVATQGLYHQPKAEEHWHKEFQIWQWGLSMPVYGLMSAKSGMAVIIDTPNDAGVIIDKQNRRPLQVEPYWMPSMGKYDYPRRIIVSFVNDTGYTTIAKRYRSYIIEKGRFKSLNQKIAERPNLKKIIGAPYVYLGYQPITDKKVMQIMDEMKAMGYEHCLFGTLRINSWDPEWMNDHVPFIRCGFDTYRHAESIGYLPYTWEWLEDMLETNPLYSADVPYFGEGDKAWPGWSNRDYKYRLVCSKLLAQYWKKNMQELSQTPALHMDVTTHVPVRECWHTDHSVSRSGDIEAKRERMKGYASLDKVFGSEGGMDWAFDLYDFCSTNPRVESVISTDNLYIPVPNRMIPFFSLVYHDSVIGYWYEQDTYMRNRNDMLAWFHGIRRQTPNYNYRDKILFDMMAGNPPTLSPSGCVFNMDSLNPKNPIELSWITWEEPRVQQIMRDALPVAQMHKRFGLMEVTEQKFLDEKLLFSRTVYENGTSVFVNFDKEPHKSDAGKEIEPESYLIVDK